MSKEPLHIVFAGTPEFAVPSLEALIADEAFSVDLVITQPDKPIGRKQVLTAPPIKQVAEKYDIPVWQPQSINKEFDNCPLKSVPNFLVVVAYGQLISQQVIDWPTIAALNIHASLLPHLRGAAPLQNSILRGDDTSGVTIQKIVKKLDAGDIVAQQEIVLDARETSMSLHDKLAGLGALLLPSTLKKPLTETVQDESKVTICSKLTRDDGVINTDTMTAEEIDRHVRALVPWPGVSGVVNGETVKIIETSLEETNDSLPLLCHDGSTVHIVRLQSPGKTVVTGREWLRGK